MPEVEFGTAAEFQERALPDFLFGVLHFRFLRRKSSKGESALGARRGGLSWSPAHLSTGGLFSWTIS